MISRASASVGGSILHGLETPFECTVLFDGLAIFAGRRRTDALYVTAGQRGLQNVCGVERTFGRTGSDQRVQLVDENDILAALFELGHYLFEPFLKLAAIFCAGDDQRQVEREDAFVFKKGRDVLVDDPLGEALDDGGFADARFADQDRIILCPAAEYLDDAFHLGLAADERVEPSLSGLDVSGRG